MGPESFRLTECPYESKRHNAGFRVSALCFSFSFSVGEGGRDESSAISDLLLYGHKSALTDKIRVTRAYELRKERDEGSAKAIPNKEKGHLVKGEALATRVNFVKEAKEEGYA
mgnify:CR=1 FL=1